MAYRRIHPQFQDTFVHYQIPSNIQESLWNYLGYGLPPGSFVTSVLRNDFLSAACHADHTWTGESFKDLAKWIINTMPIDSYGNNDKISMWMRKSDQERLEIMIEMGLRPGEFDILKGVAVA